MSDTTTISVRLSKATKDRLARLAESTKRSQAFLAAEAIEEFVEINEWQVAHIEQAIAEADAGGPFVAHEDVTAWVEALGSENELPPPVPTLRRK
ncbi:MAG: CopG family ribbon-helix-helix protein [Rhodospirillales bacterium]|nr:CopG family ribbon-helix-helix protein [Rhodospirillales bacterium]